MIKEGFGRSQMLEIDD